MNKEEIKKYIVENMTIESTVYFGGVVEVEIKLEGDSVCKTEFEVEQE